MSLSARIMVRLCPMRLRALQISDCAGLTVSVPRSAGPTASDRAPGKSIATLNSMRLEPKEPYEMFVGHANHVEP